MLAGAGPTVRVGKLNRAFSSCHSLASSFVLMGSGPGSWSSSLKLFGQEKIGSQGQSWKERHRHLEQALIGSQIIGRGLT